MDSSSGSDNRKGSTRREFLVNTGIALGGAIVAPNVVLAQTGSRKPLKKVRIGIVGGGFGNGMAWHRHPDCVVQAVSDLREDRRNALVQHYQCSNAYNSLEELIKDPNVDAVAVFTEAPNHVKHALECFKAGKHVVSAVPAATSLEDAERLRDAVQKSGLTYMMFETSYYRQGTISARKFYKEGKFGKLFYTEAEYFHPNPPGFISPLWHDPQGKRTWRYALPPMWYPTHATAFLVGVTGERLVSVMCLGFNDGTEPYQNNSYKNPFGSQVALFKTNRANILRVGQIWRGAVRGTERAEWYGNKFSFFMEHPNGMGPVIVRTSGQIEKDDGGFERQMSEFEQYDQPMWWKTEMLPEPLRQDSGHGGSHNFLVNEFVDALVKGRKPAVDVYEALAYTVPGIIAHQSSIKGGQQMRVPSFDPSA